MPSSNRTSSCRGSFVLGWVLLAGVPALTPAGVQAQTLERADGGGASDPQRQQGAGSEDVREVTDGKPSYVTTRDVSGRPGEVIALALAVQSTAGDGIPSVYLLNVPNEAIIADASHAVVTDEDRATVDVTGWNLAELTISVPARETRSYLLGVAALSHPVDGRPLRTTHAAFTVAITARERADAEPAVDASARPRTDAPREDRPAEPLRSVAERAKPSIAGPDLATATRPAGPPSATPPRAGQPQISEARSEPSNRAAPALPAPTAPAPSPSADARTLLERAARLIKLGDISGARLVLERGMARGDRQATFLLAQTYDPRVLRSWNVQGLRPDPARAGALYEAAQAEPTDPRVTADARR